MKLHMKVFLLAVLVVAIGVFGAQVVTANESSPPEATEVKKAEGQLLMAAVSGADTEVVGPQAAARLDQLAEIILANQRYRRLLASASSEDSLVLRIQMESNEDRFMETMAALGTLSTPQTDGDDLHSRLTTIHLELMPYMWALIDELRTEIDSLRGQRLKTEPAELAVLELNIDRSNKRLDLVLSFTLDHLKALNALGATTAQEEEKFQQLLRDRLDELSGRMELTLVRINGLGTILADKPGETEPTLQLAAVKSSFGSTTASMGSTLDLMTAVGIPDQAARTRLIEINQDLAAGILDVRVTATLARRAWASLVGWVQDEGPGYAVKILLVLVILIGGWFVSRLVRKAVDKSLSKAKLNISQLLHRTIVTFAHNVVLGLTLMVVLAQFGISLGPLLAGLGVVGFILGFAMQDSLSNFASGLMILFYRPYDVGDLVEISGAFGKVEHMSMVSTSILTLDNQKLVVPNSKIWGDVIKNVTDQHVRRVDMVFGISYTDDIPQTEKVLKSILEENEMVLKHPEPMVHLHTLNDSSVDFVVRPWVKTDDYWDTYWAVTREVKMRFDAEGISIPFPQRDVHLYEQKGEA